MERRLNFEGIISHLFLKAKTTKLSNWKNTMPMLHKNCKESEFTGLIRHFRWNRIMTGATVSIKILSSL